MMLSKLSGNLHLVHTGVCIISGVKDLSADRCKQNSRRYIYNASKTFLTTTRVQFISLSEKDITSYVDTGESYDKAGGYGIQGLGGMLVDRLEGCYFNVMGLPISALSRELAAMTLTSR